MNVLRSPAAAVARSRARTAARPWSVEAKLVVHLALLGVGKHLVRFLDLLELFFRGFVSRIEIRMVFARQLAIRCAKFLHRSLPRNS